MSKKYNAIYSQIVQSKDDLVGMIAYAIYKEQKLEYIRKLREEKGADLCEDECRSFVTFSTTPSQISNYRKQAEIMLTEAVAHVAKEEIARFEHDMLKNYKSEIRSCIPSNMKNFGFSVVAGIASTFLFSIIAGLFYFIGETSDRSNRQRAQEIMEEVQQETADSIPLRPVAP